MKKTTVLFDLDGTLLPMDQDKFVKAYFGGICSVLAPCGIAPDLTIKAILRGTEAMIKNDGSCPNVIRFWEQFNSIVGDRDDTTFEYYYANEFDKLKVTCGYDPRAKEIIELVRSRGLTPVLATNPIFPHIATSTRIRWAGLDEKDFRYVTTYENSSFCKPNPLYYSEILKKLGLSIEECVMVGNDATEDLAAEAVGIPVFILTDGIINRDNIDVSSRPHGSFYELNEFIKNLD